MDPTGLRVFTASQDHTPARSAALIMAEMLAVFPPAAGRVLGAAPMEVVPMVAVDDIRDGMYVRETY